MDMKDQEPVEPSLEREILSKGKSSYAHSLASYNHGQNVLNHFCISGTFSNSQRSNPSPHPTNNCMGWREGELQDNFEKDALF